MPTNETGEFELVLGNRQLLSGFAVVAILFGVFFAMGYIVGRNSTPASRAAAAADTAVQPDTGRAQNAPAPSTPLTAATTEAAGAAPAPAPAPVEPAPAPTTQAARAPEAARPPEKPAEAATPSVQAAE